jgi:hypothetical protein
LCWSLYFGWCWSLLYVPVTCNVLLYFRIVLCYVCMLFYVCVLTCWWLMWFPVSLCVRYCLWWWRTVLCFYIVLVLLSAVISCNKYFCEGIRYNFIFTYIAQLLYLGVHPSTCTQILSDYMRKEVGGARLL